MSDDKYLRSVEDLEKVGCKWWPEEIQREAYNVSILKTLLDSQERFISLLILADANNPEALFRLIENSTMSLQMFLKHLAILTDFGSEPIQRVNKNFTEIFPDRKLIYRINGVEKEYQFTYLPCRGIPTNERLQSDSTDNLLATCRRPDMIKDFIMMLLYGSAATDMATKNVLKKCAVHELLGNEEKVKKFVRENYIRVSKIISGKTANDLGNVLQSYSARLLREKLGEEYNVVSPGTIPGVQLDDNKEATFDIVVDKKNATNKYKPYVGIEVSFQETSNSVVERKGREAQIRFQRAQDKRCYVAYIIDGVGNFSRAAAANDMCNSSHCNVAFTDSELNLLCEFIKEKLA